MPRAATGSIGLYSRIFLTSRPSQPDDSASRQKSVEVSVGDSLPIDWWAAAASRIAEQRLGAHASARWLIFGSRPGR
jgi:hypothetical protein